MRGIISLLPLTIPLLATPSHSFLPPPSPFLSTTTASTTRLLMASKKINHKIDPDSANVVHRESLELGEKKVYCRCWKSDTFPYCDGAHMMHNKATGDNVGPMIVVTAKLVEGSSTKEEERAVTIKEEESSTLGRKIKNYLGFDNRKVADGLTTRERLAKMGLSALLSYGWVSNMSYAVTLSLSWYGFSKKVRRAVYSLMLVLIIHSRIRPSFILHCTNRRVCLLWHRDNGNPFWQYTPDSTSLTTSFDRYASVPRS